MAWVRYDDQFPTNPKVTAAIVEDPGSLGLHVLANTWSNAQKRPGYVPAHQPAALLADRGLAQKWASVLVHARLWEETSNLCAECREEYADLPTDAVGYVFHNAKEYRPPARDRTTPGTSAELSEKRRAAGRAGGRAAARRRASAANLLTPANAANQANADLLEANSVAKVGEPVANAVANGTAHASNHSSGGGFAGVSNGSNLLLAGVTPEPVPVPVVASSEATTSLRASHTKPALKRGTRISDDFQVTEAMVLWAREHAPNVDGRRETEKFINYWSSKAGKDATKLDWVKTWRNWMFTAADRAGTTRASPHRDGRSVSTSEELAKWNPQP